MKKLRSLVVEDEGLSRRRIENMVRSHQELDLIEDSATNGSEALERIKLYKPDLLLLDIELKDYNMFEIIERINPFTSKIIFITAYSNYAVKAFDVEAVDYLLKPFTPERFDLAVQKVLLRGGSINLIDLKNVIKRFGDSNKDRIIIPEGNTNHFVDGDTVDYIYSQGAYVNIVSFNQKKLIRVSLKTLEDILPNNFRRINKSVIINREKINEIIRYKSSIRIIMKDKNEFLLSEKFKDNFEDFGY